MGQTITITDSVSYTINNVVYTVPIDGNYSVTINGTAMKVVSNGIGWFLEPPCNCELCVAIEESENGE